MDLYSQQAQHEFNKRLTQFKEQNQIVTEEDEAILFAQATELLFLKAPQSAVFPPHNQFNVVKIDDEYMVVGYVDAQNSYGALIRTPFEFKVKNDDNFWYSDAFKKEIKKEENEKTAKIVNAFIIAIGFLLMIVMACYAS